jgi:WD40 repeat protein/tetratricopeptide (TPR) repeat protein
VLGTRKTTCSPINNHKTAVRAEQIFAAALEIADASERRAYLDRTCANDQELRREVESLLSADSQASGFLEEPPTVWASAQEMAGLATPLAEQSGDHVVVFCADKTLWTWNLNNGEPTLLNLRLEGGITAAQFSPDGRRLATISSATVQVWDVGTGQPFGSQLKHDWPFFLTAAYRPNTHIQFSPKGDRICTHALLTNSVDSLSLTIFVRVWDALTSQMVAGPFKVEARNQSPLYSAEFSQDGDQLLLLTQARAMIWDVRTRKIAAESLAPSFGSLTAHLSPDNSRLVTGGLQKTARIWDARTGEPLSEPLLHVGEVISVRFSPDGLRIVTVCREQTGKLLVRLWDAHTGQPVTESIPTKLFHGIVRGAVQPAWGDPVPALEIRFSVDGQWLVVSASDGAQVWHIPNAPSPVPKFFIELAEAVGGERFNTRGISESVPPDDLLKLKENLSAPQDEDFYSRCASWFFADRSSRTNSPLSKITIPEYVQSRIQQGRLEDLREALRLAPRNAKALARLGRQIISESSAQNFRSRGEAEFFIRRAMALAPEAAESLWARAEYLVRTDQLGEGLDAIDRAIQKQPQDPAFWFFAGSTLERTNRFNLAYDAFSKAIEFASRQPEVASDVLKQALLKRSDLLGRQNRPAEARIDYLRAKGIPPRDLQNNPHLMDLSNHYNAGLSENWHGWNGYTLGHVPIGVHRMAGVEFGIRGIVQLSAPHLLKGGMVYPDEVKGIQVGQTCRRIHFLHSVTTSLQKAGVRIGSYMMHYVDGHTQDLPIVYGEDVREWTDYPYTKVTKGTVAWQAGTPNNDVLRLWKSTWENPLPDLPVATIDYVSAKADAGTFLDRNHRGIKTLGRDRRGRAVYLE